MISLKDIPGIFSPKIMAPILLASTVLLGGGDLLANFLGAQDLLRSWRIYIGFAWLLSLSVLVTNWMTRVFGETGEHARRKVALDNLTHEEQRVLFNFILHRCKTWPLDSHDGVVQGLVEKNIVWKSSQMKKMGGWDHNIADWAYDYLMKHPKKVSVDR